MIKVVAAIIIDDNKVFATQRGYGDFKGGWEFPGGKVEVGEENYTALERELKEEMDMNVSIGEDDYLLTVEHIYPDFAITMHAYLCKVGNPDFVMREHVDYKWLSVSELDTLEWAEADKPIVEWLKKEFI